MFNESHPIFNTLKCIQKKRTYTSSVVPTTATFLRMHFAVTVAVSLFIRGHSVLYSSSAEDPVATDVDLSVLYRGIRYEQQASGML